MCYFHDILCMDVVEEFNWEPWYRYMSLLSNVPLVYIPLFFSIKIDT